MENRKSLVLGESKVCDFSNQRIKRNEPRMVLYHLPIKNTKTGISQKTLDFHVKKDSLESFKSSVKNSQKIDENFSRDYISCPHKNSEFIIETDEYEGVPKMNLRICEECQGVLIKIAENMKERIEKNVYYWSQKGICIQEPKRLRECQITQEKIEQKALIIGSELGEKDSYKLYKILEIKNKLDDIEKETLIEEKKCRICNRRIKFNSEAYDLDFTQSDKALHPKCLATLKEEIDKIIKNENSYIISKRI